MGVKASEAERRLLSVSCGTYKTHGERSAMRCALGDAAALCDAIAVDVTDEYRGRGGVIKKHGQELAQVLAHAASLIWAMREKIEVPKQS